MSRAYPSSLTDCVGRLTIQDKDRRLRLLTPNWSQHQVLDQVNSDLKAGRPSRIIVLKARQLGVSTITEAILFSLILLVRGTRAVVLAHETPASQNLFGYTKLFYESLPAELKRYYKHRYSTKRSLVLDSNMSGIEVLTAENEQAARSRTIHALHCSEVGLWKEDKAEDAMGALNLAVPRLPGTVIILESTAFGQGNFFHQEWLRAIEGDSDYTPIFLPWWRHEEYLMPSTLKDLEELDEEETALVEEFKLGPERLAWRRYTIRNDCGGSLDKFHQEHPSTWQEAFLSTGRNVFAGEELDACYVPSPVHVGNLYADARRAGRVTFRSERGHLRIYKQAGRNRTYFVGASPQHPAFDDVPSVAQVINRDTCEQVACWDGICDPITFAEELARLGAFYNQAMVAPDVHDIGYAIIPTLSRIYPNVWEHQLADRRPGKTTRKGILGYANNWQRQGWSIGWVMRMIAENRLLLHDQATYDDLKALSVQPVGSQAYDYQSELGLGRLPPRILALAIACMCSRFQPTAGDPQDDAAVRFIMQDGQVRMLAPPTDM